MIQELQEEGFTVKKACSLFGVSQSGYYRAMKKRPTPRQERYVKIKERIISLFFLHKGRYGRVRLRRELKKEGLKVSEKFIAQTLKERNLMARKRRGHRPKTTTQGKEKAAPNHLQTRVPTAPNQVLVTDITYLPTKEGFLYLSALMDLYTRKIKGYALSNSLHTNLTLESLEDALGKHPELIGALHHSDRGCQYTSHAYAEYLKRYQLKPSMSATGYCYDNAAMESFWATLKTEIGDEPIKVFESKEHARQEVFEYIEGYYNTIRIHSGIDYRSPDELECSAA